MNGINRKLEKIEGKYPLYGGTESETRRKYSGICIAIKSFGDSMKRNKNTDLFGWMSGMQTLTDQSGDGCHKFISSR